MRSSGACCPLATPTMPSPSKVITLASAPSANCRNQSSSPTCCTACINVMLFVVIGITPWVRMDFSKLHLTGVFPMAQPLGHLSKYTTPVDSTLPMASRLVQGGWHVVGYDVQDNALEQAVSAGVQPAWSPAEVARVVDRTIVSVVRTLPQT